MFLLDVGNTGLKWAYLRRDKLTKEGRLDYVSQSLADSLDVHWKNLPKPRRAVICNVGSAETAGIVRDWMKQHWRVNAQFIQPVAEACGVRNAYFEPQRLGSDRWAALVAVRRKFRKSAIVVDCGTAITIDAMDRDGKHLGGLILPGMAMMRDSLISGTEGIVLKANQPEAVSLLARDTEGAVAGGVLYTAVAVIDRVLADVTAAIGSEMAYVITGGDAQVLLPLLMHSFNYEPDLVLQGVAQIASARS